MAMFSEEEMLRDLDAADAAGDTKLAQHIADRIKAQRAGGGAPEVAAPTSGEKIAGAAKWILRQPLELLGGVKDSVSDLALGARQLGAYAGLGDKEALSAEAEAAAAAAKNRSTAGDLGKLATDIGTSFLPMGGVAKMARFLPEATTLAGRAFRALAPSVGSGAAMDVLSPEKNYDPVRKAEVGGLIGAAADVVGRVPGGVYKTLTRNASPLSREAAAVLERAGMPSPTASTMTDSEMVRQTTDAAGMLPIFGHKIQAKRNENLDWFTKLVSKEAGMGPEGLGVPQLTRTARDANAQRLNTMANEFRAGGDVPLPGVGERLSDVANTVAEYARATTQAGKLTPIRNAARSVTPKPVEMPGPNTTPGIYGTLDSAILDMPQMPISRTIEEASTALPHGYPGHPVGVPPTNVPPGPPAMPTISSSELMDRRRAASELAHSEATRAGGDPVLAKKYREMRGLYDDALKATHGDAGKAFETWLKQTGAQSDVLAAFEKGQKGGRLIPQYVHDVIQKSGGMHGIEPIVEAASMNIAKPPPGWNRAWLTGMLLGAPIGMGAASGIASGDAGVGTYAGAGTAAALWTMLSRTPSSPAKSEMIRKLMTAGVIGGGT